MTERKKSMYLKNVSKVKQQYKYAADLTLPEGMFRSTVRILEQFLSQAGVLL